MSNVASTAKNSRHGHWGPNRIISGFLAPLWTLLLLASFPFVFLLIAGRLAVAIFGREPSLQTFSSGIFIPLPLLIPILATAAIVKFWWDLFLPPHTHPAPRRTWILSSTYFLLLAAIFIAYAATHSWSLSPAALFTTVALLLTGLLCSFGAATVEGS